jgi:hypothetical protein
MPRCDLEEPVTGGDVAAMITAAGGATAAVLGGIALVRKKSGDLYRTEQQELNDCSAWRRAAVRIIRALRDLLSEAGIPEPEGIDDELGLRPRAVNARRDTDETA